MYPGESGDQEGCSTALLWQGPLKPPDPLLVQLIGALSFTKTLISIPAWDIAEDQEKQRPLCTAGEWEISCTSQQALDNALVAHHWLSLPWETIPWEIPWNHTKSRKCSFRRKSVSSIP